MRAAFMFTQHEFATYAGDMTLRENIELGDPCPC
jgi:hypothetical protein